MTGILSREEGALKHGVLVVEHEARAPNASLQKCRIRDNHPVVDDKLIIHVPAHHFHRTRANR